MAAARRPRQVASRTPPPPPSAGDTARQAGRQQAVRFAGGGGGTGPSGGAHKLVLAEYLAVMLILFATEILGPLGQGKTAPSPQDAAKSPGAGILVRMTAASILFFVLALMANGPRAGRIAAAFGGLVTLGTALNAGPVWTGLGRVFGGAAAQPPAAGEGGGGPLTAGEGGSSAGEGSGGQL